MPKGKCLCGKVEFLVEDAFEYSMNCHCSNCQRRTGSAFKSFAGISSGLLAIEIGASEIAIYGDPNDAHDVQCGTCGSLLYSVVREGAYVHVPMGVMVSAPSIRPSAHIFVGSKAEWYDITDDLPQYEEFPE